MPLLLLKPAALLTRPRLVAAPLETRKPDSAPALASMSVSAASTGAVNGLNPQAAPEAPRRCCARSASSESEALMMCWVRGRSSSGRRGDSDAERFERVGLTPVEASMRARRRAWLVEQQTCEAEPEGRGPSSSPRHVAVLRVRVGESARGYAL
eukprot:60729-Rhodomonas_salina.3